MKFAVIAVVLILSLPIALALDAAYGTYAGEGAVRRRFGDPYTRYSYFGENYSKSVANYGSKGPNYRMTTTGAKSAYSGTFNLDTNEFTIRGRDPGQISNWDPNVRGIAQLDIAVSLLPPGADIAYDENGRPRGPQGTARVLSRGDAYGAGQYTTLPNTQVYIQSRDLPPIPSSMKYEAWLVDEDTGYALSLGIMKAGTKFTSKLDYQSSRMSTGYDAVMITQESYPDIDPSPSGEVMLYGPIGPVRRTVAELGSAAPRRLR